MSPVSPLISPLTYDGLRRERVLASPQYRDGVFHNAHAVFTSGMSWPVLKEFFTGGAARAPQSALPVVSPLDAWRSAPASGLRITWLGHSTMLFEIDGLRVLTDPVFGPRASPFSFAGAKRWHPVPVTLAQLPPIDVVLLSHDHYDHLCASTMRQLARMQMPIVTSLGVGARLEAFGVHPSRITELDWWESHTILGGALSFTATPAQHFAGRGLRDRNQTLWSSWVLETANSRVFFSGDTGLHADLTTIAQRFGPFDVTMLEIGASNPAWSAIHLGPENALTAFEMMGGGTLLPIHWSTFDLALHAWDEPAETLLRLAANTGSRLLTPMLGQPIEPSHVDAPTPWWRGVHHRAAQSVSHGAMQLV
jgi:L-ascorbate metabolism protein UlaG (beta-lactamase superfamily)